MRLNEVNGEKEKEKEGGDFIDEDALEVDNAWSLSCVGVCCGEGMGVVKRKKDKRGRKWTSLNLAGEFKRGVAVRNRFEVLKEEDGEEDDEIPELVNSDDEGGSVGSSGGETKGRRLRNRWRNGKGLEANIEVEDKEGRREVEEESEFEEKMGASWGRGTQEKRGQKIWTSTGPEKGVNGKKGSVRKRTYVR